MSSEANHIWPQRDAVFNEAAPIFRAAVNCLELEDGVTSKTWTSETPRFLVPGPSPDIKVSSCPLPTLPQCAATLGIDFAARCEPIATLPLLPSLTRSDVQFFFFHYFFFFSYVTAGTAQQQL